MFTPNTLSHDAWSDYTERTETVSVAWLIQSIACNCFYALNKLNEALFVQSTSCSSVFVLYQYYKCYHWQRYWPPRGWGSLSPPWCWLTSWDKVDTKLNQLVKTGSRTGVSMLPALVTHINFKTLAYDKNMRNDAHTDSSPVLLLNRRRRLVKARTMMNASMSRMQKTAIRPFFQPASITVEQIQIYIGYKHLGIHRQQFCVKILPKLN